ncbi:MAG: 3-isopropylmalate dehydratase small subunit [Sphingomonadaceae bacterium]|nr:3-isopropylmalate dehydratase small subunit [Sphingomonadaceae bacterium]
MTAFPPVPTVTGRAIALVRPNIDTDAIIPSRWMRGTGKTGLADGLFAAWRYVDEAARTPDPDFPLNLPGNAGAPILLGGPNFGCGSSREHAVWALHEWGVRAVIAPSFAPIFRANCVRNGVIPVELPEDAIAALSADAGEVTVDLLAGEVRAAGRARPFAIDGEARTMLAEGLDAIDLTLKNADSIASWIDRDRAARPWVYLGAAA